MKAYLKNHRQTPRKVRLIVDVIRGKSVDEANRILSFLKKKAAQPIQKLLSSAVSNAKQKGENIKGLFIQDIFVDEGQVLKRWVIKGRAVPKPIKKRNSHITIKLGKK